MEDKTGMTEPKLSELLTTAALYQLDAQDTHQMNVMAEMAASLEAQVKAMREAMEKVWLNATSHGTHEPYASIATHALDTTASLDTPAPPNK